MNYLQSIITLKCPRCRKGNLFTHKWYQLKKVTNMPKKCSVCGQRTELEVGFYYGTGYVSYALSIAITVASFIAWWWLVGIRIYDNRVFYWIGVNATLLLLLQPWMMRVSRVIWLSWFYHKDDEKHQLQQV